jgi:hypothetical protein
VSVQFCTLKYASRETHSHRIKKDTKLLHKIIDFTQSFRNPFTGNDNHLINISSEKFASHATKQFLLTTREKGESMRKTFIQRCISDPSVFLQPIPRQKLLTFSSEGVKIIKLT